MWSAEHKLALCWTENHENLIHWVEVVVLIGKLLSIIEKMKKIIFNLDQLSSFYIDWFGGNQTLLFPLENIRCFFVEIVGRDEGYAKKLGINIFILIS